MIEETPGNTTGGINNEDDELDNYLDNLENDAVSDWFISLYCFCFGSYLLIRKVNYIYNKFINKRIAWFNHAYLWE